MDGNARILCHATVDHVLDCTWDVTVWGERPFDATRNYTLTAKDDNSAAFEGIRRFTAEMEALRDGKTKD
jgi:hypothetical protein